MDAVASGVVRACVCVCAECFEGGGAFVVLSDVWIVTAVQLASIIDLGSEPWRCEARTQVQLLTHASLSSLSAPPPLYSSTPVRSLKIGRVASIEKEHEDVEEAKVGDSVCIKIQPGADQETIQVGRHFDETAVLYSLITRDSIDSLKDNHKDDLSKEEWRLVIRMKEVFQIS